MRYTLFAVLCLFFCTAGIADTVAVDLNGVASTSAGLRDSGWTINKNKHLEKQFKFKDFAGAMAFANHIAALAEKANHHPVLTISWGICKIELWTHDTNGLTKKDSALAHQIEQIH